MSRRLLLLLGATLLIIAAPQAVLAQVSSSPLPPEAFHRSMIFVDGTSLFYRFEEMKLCVASFYDLLIHFAGGRRKPRISRIYWYTIQEKYERLLKIHGENCLDKVRVIFGTGVPTSGEPKEKGVDSLLVADIIYHAAQKNMDYAQLAAIDLDFVYAIHRVEDFGCRTAVLAFGQNAPDALQKGCDEYHLFTRERLLSHTTVTDRTLET
jgi:uncharacterized LabA/DUF88 family protein